MTTRFFPKIRKFFLLILGTEIYDVERSETGNYYMTVM